MLDVIGVGEFGISLSTEHLLGVFEKNLKIQLKIFHLYKKQINSYKPGCQN